MIYYHQAIRDQELVLSIDNIVIDASITNPAIRDLLDTIIASIASSNRIGIRTWTSSKPGTFRNQTVFQIDDERSFWLGHGLIGRGTLIDRYRLDANPNKVGTDPNFNNIREFLVRNARKGFCKVSRFDLAIDIPVDRSQCFLVKDRRMYIERRHGEEFTQYLGSKSSNAGRVKLYNKTLEAKLDFPLTRLELTLNPSTPYEDLNFPVVYSVDPTAVINDNIRITDTQRFIVDTICQGHGALNDLGRKTRAKIESLLQNYVRQISISKESYEQILEQVSGYIT